MYINFRSAKQSDAKTVLDIYRRAAKKMTECGIDQWDELYPDMSDVTDDISQGCLSANRTDRLCLYILLTENGMRNTKMACGNILRSRVR